MFLYKTYTNLTIQPKPSKPSIITAIALKKNEATPANREISKYENIRVCVS